MAKLILLKGIPGSGKSTWAKEFIANNKDYIRVNRDLLRKMLHFEVFTPKNEAVTIAVEMAAVKAAIESGHRNVLVDDTNISKSVIDKWMNFAQQNRWKFEIKEFTTSPEECIERDNKREGFARVGPDVIWKFARQAGYKNGKRDVICDIDGTLSDITHRRKYVTQENSWVKFFAGIADDLPRQHVIDKVKELNKQFNIVLVSGRPEDYKEVTIEWLKKYDVPYQCLIMRRKGDFREDGIIKKEILETYFDKDNIELVIDDRPRVIRMWREEGLKVEDVGDGIEF